jgi:hypothetical protein
MLFSFDTKKKTTKDPVMTGILLRAGADVNARCYGAFFCPDDQVIPPTTETYLFY